MAKTGEEKKFRTEAITALEGYPWPGNIRQLENTGEPPSRGVDRKHIEYADLEGISASAR